MIERVADFFSAARATRNAAAVIESHRTALAEVDNAVARLQRHVAAPAAA